MADTPTLKLYNTLTREKVAFAPIDPGNVRMYVCGPTVYDFAHIGNARPAIVFDVMFRLLKHLAKQGVWDDGKGETRVTYVRNITDVDDKINARALRDYPGMELNAAIRLVTEKTDRQYQDDVKALGCLEPTEQPRATEHIAGMVRIIQQLIDRGHAYFASGGEGREVLFATGSMSDYGQLSRRKLEDQQAGARVAIEAHKKNPADFVLWKESAADQPGWPAEFTVDGVATSIFGRPGWHIECSAMSEAFLGETFDIHGGGLDLIFPHHENEIAQSRCAHGTNVMANVWMHNGFLQVEGKKMSKSDGNFVTIYELLHTDKFGGRKWPGEVLRLAMLMTHYRQPIDFSIKRLEEAEGMLQTWADAKKIASDHDWTAVANRMVEPRPDVELVEALEDELNTAGVISFLQRAANDATRGDVDSAFRLLNGAAFLGFTLEGLVAESLVEEAEILLAISERLSLFKSKNFTEADKIRDELLAKGIQLKDGKDPATGERVTTWEVKR
ncbi:MAG: cysteinyl-tRNA synthetase [Rhizobium sp.]|nr:cysteinyl-tRNA synthetase [Rhizobium sp.]